MAIKPFKYDSTILAIAQGMKQPHDERTALDRTLNALGQQITRRVGEVYGVRPGTVWIYTEKQGRTKDYVRVTTVHTADCPRKEGRKLVPYVLVTFHKCNAAGEITGTSALDLMLPGFIGCFTLVPEA